MAYITRKQTEAILESFPEFRDVLYCRGFLLTDDADIDLSSYPFYGEWIKENLNETLFVIHHSKVDLHIYRDDEEAHFLIGHAYNPFNMKYEERKILHDLHDALQISEADYWSAESELTGVFCVGYIKGNMLQFATDCTGMQLIFYGRINNYFYLTSHAKLVADLCDLHQDSYITRLINSRFYHYWGCFLPGDLSPYTEMKRVVPNFAYHWNFGSNEIEFKRFYPTEEVAEVSAEQTPVVIDQAAEIMRNTLTLIAKKWGKRAAISVTGGRDSGATLASAVDVYDDLKYFSYISQDSESYDAYAAKRICEHLNLRHVIYEIPRNDSAFDGIEAFRLIMECNAGCIGRNNANDVRKRFALWHVKDFDVEVKSWVSELARCEGENKYGTTKWPSRPTPGYFRCLWKVVVDPDLIRESNVVFRNYLKTYFDQTTLERLSWLNLYYWEFSWSSGEGCFLTSEHRVSYDITVPFNNRKLIDLSLRIPFECRLADGVPIGIAEVNNPRLLEAGAHIHNVAHTDNWARMIRAYLKIFSVFGRR